MDTEALKMLMALSTLAGPPGAEEGVARVFASYLGSFCTVERDGFGSVIAELPGGNERPRLLLMAHMDEVGFMVRAVTPGGMVKLHPLGGWPDAPLAAHRFLIHTKKGEVLGLAPTVPPHHEKTRDEKDKKPRELLLDVGCLSRQEVEGLGVETGDMATPEPCFRRLSDKVLMNKAWDDRAGLAAMIAALMNLKEADFPGTVIACGSVQEEVGARGAYVVAERLRADAALVVEGAPADDFEGLTPDDPQAALGRGVQIRWFDPGAISHRGLTRWLINLCREENIPHQVAVRTTGGTDARHVQLKSGGAPTAAVGIPVRYAHSPAGLIHLDDFYAAVKLVEAAASRLTGEMLDEIRDKSL